MAHALKYYKELTHDDGKVIRLEILEKGYTGASMEIGPVCQALRLDIQGDSEIDAPIVKTSLTMTFVDAPDHAEAGTKKCGNWEEFYTNDATYWQVVLKAMNAGETSFRKVWGGYVTPDSYNEVLVYRGSVTIVARDNIGHMNDFPFDAEGDENGMISLLELVREAWDKIESPMTLDDQAIANAEWMLTEGVYAYDTYMNVSAFEDMTWGEALESALYAYGLTLRYTGYNNVSFYPLRNLPRLGVYEAEDIIYKEPIFVSGAERELTPAVKRIEESVSYKLEDNKPMPLAESVTFTGSIGSIPYESQNVFGEKEWVNIPAWPLSNSSDEGWGSGDISLALNPLAYSTGALAGSLGESLVLATNTDGSGRIWYGRYMQGRNFTMMMSFGQLMELTEGVSLTTILFIPVTVKKVVMSVSASANGSESYLNEDGTWQTDEVFIEIPIDESTRSLSKVIPLGSFSTDESLVRFTIKNITLGAKEDGHWWDTSDGNGIYVELASLSLSDNSGIALCETNNVNTNFSQDNNVILSREPKIAPALNNVLFPSFIKNGIFVQDGNIYSPAKTWYWGGHTPQQMAVYNHLQLLCYHAKPNNILRGTILNADITYLQTIWMWHGAEHMLVSGSLNFLNGHIENAVLREFARYEDMWGMLDEADLPEVEGTSSTNVENGAPSTSGSTTVTSNTEVYIGGGGTITLDTFMSDASENGVQNKVIKAYVDGEVKSVVDLLASMWYLDDDGNVRTKHNVVIEGDTSSGGEGEDTPSAGLDEEQLQAYLDEHGYVTEDDIAGLIPDVDLSGYYTSAQTDSAISTAIANLVNGAPTTLDTLKEISDALAENEDVVDALEAAIGTKADASALTALTTRVSTAETNITNLTNNKANKATTLAGYGITNAYTKTEIDTKVTTINNTISGVSGRVTTLETWKAEIAKYITIEDGNVKISTNLIVTGDTSSGGESGDTGTSIGSMLTSWGDYNASTMSGYVLAASLGYDLHTRVSSLEANGALTFTTTGSGNAVTSISKSGTTVTVTKGTSFLPLGGGTISGTLTIKRSASVIKYTSAGETIFGWLGFDAENSPVMYQSDGATKHTLIHSGNIGSQSVAIARKFRVIGDTTGDLNTILSGGGLARNYSSGLSAFTNAPSGASYGMVLELTGNVASSLAGQLAWDVNHASTSDVTRYLWWRASDSPNGFKYGKWHQIAFTDSNVASAQALTHSNGTVGAVVNSSGNVGIGTSSPEYKLDVAGTGRFSNAITLSGTAGTTSSIKFTRAGWSYICQTGSTGVLSFNIGDTGVANSKMYILNNGHVQVGVSENSDKGYNFYVNGTTGANGNITSVAADDSVRRVIVKNSVASSSLYVATSGNRGIYDDTNAKWMIYSDGTTTYMPYNNVSVGGSLIVGGSELKSSTPSGGSYPIWRITRSTSSVFLQAGKVDGTSTAGNLYITGINDSDLGLFAVYAPNSYFKGNVCPQSGNTYNLGASSHMWSTTYTRYIDTASGYVLRFKVAGTEYMNLSTAGNLCIGNGSSTGSERLHVYGNAIITGDTSSGSDIRFKDIIKDKTLKIADIAKAPLFTFKWNDREDDTVHLGSSAQYWEKVAPWVVSGEGFKTLNYATLGVAMGISLARKALNHEERIKALEKENKALKAEIRRISYGS